MEQWVSEEFRSLVRRRKYFADRFVGLLKIYPEFRKSFADFLMDNDCSFLTEPSEGIVKILDKLVFVDAFSYTRDELQRGLIDLIKADGMTAFNNVIEYLEITKSRNSAYLKLIEYTADGTLDLVKIRMNLSDAFEPGSLKIFSQLDEKGIFIIKSLNSNQIDYLSNFTSSGISVYSRVTKWTVRQRSLMTMFHLTEFRIMCQLPWEKIYNLYQSEGQDWLRGLKDEEVAVVRKIIELNRDDYNAIRELLRIHGRRLCKDLMYVNANSGNVSEQDKYLFGMSDEERQDFFKNLSTEEGDLLNPRILKVASRLRKEEIDLILNPRKEQIDIIAELPSRRKITEILQEIPPGWKGPLNPVYRLGEEEETFLKSLTPEQRLILSKIKVFHLIQELTDEESKELLIHLLIDPDQGIEFNLIQRVLIGAFQSLSETEQKELKALPLDIWNQLRDIRIISNLSFAGRLVLDAMTRFKEDQLKILFESSQRGLMILVGTDWLTENAIDRLEKLSIEERKFHVNLSLYERIMFKSGKKIHPSLTKMITLSREEKMRFDISNGRLKDRIIRSSQLELDTAGVLAEIDHRTLLNIFDEFRRTRDGLLLWQILIQPENLVEYLFDRAATILATVDNDLESQFFMSKLLAELITCLQIEPRHGTPLIHHIGRLLKGGKFYWGFYLNLYHYAELDQDYSNQAISKLYKSPYDLKFLAKNYNLKNEMDAKFIRSMLDPTKPRIISRTFRAILPGLARTDGSALEKIFQTEGTETLDKELCLSRFWLAKAMLLSNSEAVSRLIGNVLGSVRCLELLNSGVDHKFFKEVPAVYAEDFSKLFKTPKFFEFVLYYRCGNLVPLIRLLNPQQMKVLLKKNREKVLELIRENKDHDLLKILLRYERS